MCIRDRYDDCAIATCELQWKTTDDIAVRHRIAAGARAVHFTRLPYSSGFRPFAFEGLLRMSRNSFGPLISFRFRLSRSSTVADWSRRRSITWAAILDTFNAAFLSCGFADFEPARPRSTSRRISAPKLRRRYRIGLIEYFNRG